MRRVTINKADGYVQITEAGHPPEMYPVDLSSLPSYCQVIQWTGESGWIEFVRDNAGKVQPHAIFTDFAPYDYLVDAWRAAKKLAEEKRADAAAAELRRSSDAQPAARKKR